MAPYAHRMGVRRRLPIGAIALAACLVAGAGTARAQEDTASYRTEPRPGRVALTFDDGPNPKWTPVILDILDAYGVKATFFANGFRVVAFPEVAAEVVRRGHSLQNHGYGHAHVLELSDAGVTREIVRGAESIAAATGARTTCFRPGWGETSGRIRRLADEAGEVVVLWTVDTLDWLHQSATESVRRTLDGLQAGDVILMHDSIGWAARDALPVIIEAVRAAGLDFDAICDEGWRRELPGPSGLRPRLYHPFVD